MENGRRGEKDAGSCVYSEGAIRSPNEERCRTHPRVQVENTQQKRSGRDDYEVREGV